jgi:hypothetical protein
MCLRLVSQTVRPESVKMIPVDEKLKLLRPVIGEKKIMQLRQMYLSEDDFREKKQIENYIDILISKKVKTTVDETITLPPPDRQICDGEIYAGQIQYLDKKINPFHLRLQDINRHVGIFGSTGSGKTTFALNLIKQLHSRKIPFIIFDWETSYRHLAKKFSDAQIFTVGKDINPFFLNFLTVPPGIDFEEYIKSVIAIISEDYIGGIGADTMLLNYMEMAYHETQHPCFEDLKQIVAREINGAKGKFGRLSGRSGLWKESVSRQITFMSKGAAGKVINPRQHYPLEKLFDRSIVLEFGNLKSPYDRKFFIHLILNWLSIYKQNSGIIPEQLKNVMIFEEFHNIAMTGKEDNMVSTLFREVRKYGVGLVAIDQTPSEISNSIFANMNVKVSFGLGTNRDINAMAKAMNLKQGTVHYPGMLKTGEAIINVAQRHYDSFLIKPPFVSQPANIDDEALKLAMQQLSDQIRLISPLQSPNSTFQSSQNNETLSPTLGVIEKLVFTSIVDHPLDGVDKRTKRLGLHPSEMVKHHDSLIQKDIIKPVYVNRIKLFEITEHGKTIADLHKIAIPKKKTRGGLEHDYWINQTLEFLRKQKFEPVCEKFDIDIVSLNEKIGIEVETGKSNIEANLLKLKNLNVLTHCYMLATNKIAEQKIKKFQPSFPDIKIMTVQKFLKLRRAQIIN